MRKNSDTVFLHGTCVSIGGKGVLLLGKPGSGKSDLALRLIDSNARLVADDQVRIHKERNRLLASAPVALGGKVEARGVGVLTLPYARRVPLFLAVKLAARPSVERLPEATFWDCLGTRLPLVSLHAFDASTPAKIKLFLLSLPLSG